MIGDGVPPEPPQPSARSVSMDKRQYGLQDCDSSIVQPRGTKTCIPVVKIYLPGWNPGVGV